MTVQELKDILENMPDDMQVYYSYDYGDHCHTPVAIEVSNIEGNDIVFSCYTDTWKIKNDEYDEGKEIKTVLVIQ